MRWMIALGLIASCGRIGFDPLDDEGTGGSGSDPGTGPGVDVDSGTGGDGNSGTMPTGHYIIGGSTATIAPMTSFTAMTGPLMDTNMVLVVGIHWLNATSSISTVQDSFGNGFSMIGSKQSYNGTSHALWYKKVTAGTTIQVLFTQPAPSINVKWAAYREIDQTSPIVDFIGGAGTSTNAATAMVTLPTTAVVVASSGSRASDAAAGPGFTERLMSGGGVLEDLEAAPGMVNATATLSSSNDWIIQLTALRPL